MPIFPVPNSKISLLNTSHSASKDVGGVAEMSPSALAADGQTKRIVRRECVRSAALELSQLSALVDEFYYIYRETTHGCTRDEFASVVFGAGDARFVLFYGEGNEFAGFCYTAFEDIEYQARSYALIHAGVFFRRGYHGGTRSGFFGLRQALRFKLLHPRTPLAYLTRCSSPAVYRLLATVPRIYPGRRHQTPIHVAALARAASAQRNYVPVGNNPWVVWSAAVPCDASPLRRLEDDPDVRFYCELAGGYAEGESLLVWLPLDLSNITGGFLRLLRRRRSAR
ncbi:hypothetical protein F0Q45_14630 [Mycobacterium simiae]|uniref:Uncharacterized protein n=1 Tax=Mycobacterium simiae TaxID=1784 RepID=A0A5B1BR55_MYCSI|nr:hypothetical protein [Mycobacterium simiae]KAA1249529.1 hypothetical protein F0Q45_14630 [Mycobacterium simiae]